MIALLAWILAARAADDPTAFTTEVQGDLSRAHPDCQVEVRNALALHVTCGKTELDLFLARLWGACQGTAGACAAEKSAYYQTVTSSLVPDPPLRVEDIVPVVRSRGWLTSLPEGATAQVMTDPVVGDLVVVWMVDSPQSARTLREEELADVGLTRAALAAAALHGLRRQLDRIGDQDAGRFHILGGSYYTSSVVVDAAFWAKVGGVAPVYAVVPTYDVVLYTTSGAAGDLRKMAKEARRFARSGERLVSSAVYVWRDGGWAEP